jgi:hypothetical protein
MARARLSSSACHRCLRQVNPPILRGIRAYNTSKLSPIQPPPVTSPSSPYFVPRKLGQTTRLTSYYDELIAPNYLLMNFDPVAKRQKQLLPLRWDGTSPYHKNRPQPRDRPLTRLRQPITTKNLPVVESITVHTMVKSSIGRRPDLLNAALAVQSITGQRPQFIDSYNSVAVFKLRPRTPPQRPSNMHRNPRRRENNPPRSRDGVFPLNIIRSRSPPRQRFRRRSLRPKRKEREYKFWTSRVRNVVVSTD